MTEHEALGVAVTIALRSPCAKSRRGVVIFGHDVISHGFNGPPPPFRCDRDVPCRSVCNRVAVHAEERAILKADRLMLRGADLIHVKVDGSEPVTSGPQSCLQCSRMIVEVGIAGVWLLHESGLLRYSATDFHSLTLRHHGIAASHPA